jgi:hypothetical protein
LVKIETAIIVEIDTLYHRIGEKNEASINRFLLKKGSSPFPMNPMRKPAFSARSACGLWSTGPTISA